MQLILFSYNNRLLAKNFCLSIYFSIFNKYSPNLDITLKIKIQKMKLTKQRSPPQPECSPAEPNHSSSPKYQRDFRASYHQSYDVRHPKII